MCENELTITRGNTRPYDITVETASGPVDITGWIFYFVVKEFSDSTTALISKTVSTHVAPTQGVTQILLGDDDTDIEPGKYYYEMAYKKPDGTITTFLMDKYIVKQNLIDIS